MIWLFTTFIASPLSPESHVHRLSPWPRLEYSPVDSYHSRVEVRGRHHQLLAHQCHPLSRQILSRPRPIRNTWNCTFATDKVTYITASLENYTSITLSFYLFRFEEAAVEGYGIFMPINSGHAMHSRCCHAISRHIEARVLGIDGDIGPKFLLLIRAYH